MRTPTGCEDVHDVEELLGAVDHIIARRPITRAVVIKHDDSAAGDGNVVVPIRDTHDRRLSSDELRDAVTALPDWYLTDLASGGVVEELVEGDQTSSPSVQFDVRPGGDVQMLSTHDQILGGGMDRRVVPLRLGSTGAKEAPPIPTRRYATSSPGITTLSVV